MRNIVRECLNYRDKENMDKLFESNEKSNAGIVGVANLLKYNQGLCPSNIDGKVGDEECFGLMDEMRNMLSIYLGDIFQLSLDDEVNLNYLHLCLGFYNSRIKEAVDSDIYPLIMERIMVPYLRAPLAKSKGFMDNYLNFFKKWIYAAQMPLLLQ